MTVKVNHSTSPDGSFSVAGAAAWQADHTLTGVGTMAEQDANNVNITGGSISGATIGGVVTSVSGTAPIASSGGATPAISIPQATGSVDGYLSATDWTTFNGKQPAGTYVTSVGATAPITSSGGTTPTIAIPAATSTANGYLTSTDWSTFNGKANSGANSDITSMSGVTGPIATPTYIDFNTTQIPLPTDATGRLYYDYSDQFQTFVFQMNGNVVQHVGEEQFFRIKCQGSITKGQVVSFAGTLGASGGLIGKAATGLSVDQSNYILGVADESGINNDWIFVSSFGEVKGINTTGGAENWVQGQILYYNPSVVGGLTKTKPTAPNPIAVVAAVIHVGSSNGILFVRPTFGSVLGGTDGNVEFGTLNNLDVIQYNTTAQRWENVPASGLSVSYAATAGSAGSATNATNIGVTDDTSTNADYYPVWVTANTGNLPAKVTSTKLKFNPSTGALTATGGFGGGTF
jgi:hypothetical protein